MIREYIRSQSIMRRKISKPNTGSFARRTANYWTNDMFGIEREVRFNVVCFTLTGRREVVSTLSWASTAFQPRLSHSRPSALPNHYGYFEYGVNS